MLSADRYRCKRHNRQLGNIALDTLPISKPNGITIENNDRYRTKKSGDWDDISVWEYFDGTQWVNAPNYPSATYITCPDPVASIQNGDTIKLNTNIEFGNVIVDTGGILEIQDGAELGIIADDTLTVDGKLIMHTTAVVNGAGNFELKPASTIYVGSSLGITINAAEGNIQVTGDRYYLSEANYVYTGTANQVTGDGLMQNKPANLTIDAPGIVVTSSEEIDISGDIHIIHGTFDVNNLNITLEGNWTNDDVFLPGTATVYFNNSVNVYVSVSNFYNIIFAGTDTVTATGQLTIYGDITINNYFDAGSYTHYIHGNWINNGTFVYGTSIIVFIGTSQQTIEGTNETEFYGFTVNNSSGISLYGNIIVKYLLTLTDGIVITSSYSVTVSETGSITGGSATAYIYGKLICGYNSIGSKTFPVGTATEYGSMVLNYLTLTGTSFVEVEFIAGTIPGTLPGSITTVADHYWVISQNGGSVFTFTSAILDWSQGGDEQEWKVEYGPVRFTPGTGTLLANISSKPLEITGLTAEYYYKFYVQSICSEEVQSSWAGPAPFSTFPKQLDATIFLEGPYDESADNMNTNSGMLPLTQPYSGSPWNYSGTEQVASIPTGVVDWVLIEWREASSPASANGSNYIWRKAAFLKNDGSVVDMYGSSLPWIGNPQLTGSLYLIVRHRNHLDVISNFGANLVGEIYSYDFSDQSDKVYGGNNAHKQIDSSPLRFGMAGGDGVADGHINLSDKNFSWEPDVGKTGYLDGDFNMNGQTDNQDKNDVWFSNNGYNGFVPD